ncbi:MAG: permease, partial [Halolamina sp.]
WEDIAIGFLIAGLLEAFVPRSFWLDLFTIGGADGVSWVVVSVVVATAVGVLTFLCSVGNVPFALVLWNNGVAFGGVLSFIYADLIIPPLVRAHKRYFGARMAAVVFAVIFVAAVVAGVFIHYAFGLAGLIPPAGEVGGTAPSGYTVVLNLLFTGVFLGQLYVAFGPQRLAMAGIDGVASVVTGLTVVAMAVAFVAGGLETTSTVVDEGANAAETVAASVENARDDLDRWVEETRERVSTWE